MQENNTTHQWSANLTLNEAVKYSGTLKTNLLVTIFVDNRTSIQASSSPKTTNRTARENFEILLEKPHINISWIKAHVGYFGNEAAASLAKAAAESNDVQLDIKLPKCHAKNILRKDIMKEWQSEWDEEDKGRSTFNIFPKVSLELETWNRADVLFFTGHGPFPSYLHRFNLANSPLCSCVEIGTPIHYATSYLFTTSRHMKLPKPSLEQKWYRGVPSNHLSSGRIRGIINRIPHRSFLSQTGPVKPQIHQLLNQGSNQFFSIRKPSSATSTFSSASHPVKTNEKV
ncbi:hypothetical protein AVEN_131049-1 [Araneus ventricosus]|uniref:RNase H type-1 domain-containing protein n=1 Tax=Araneus ventricosus TaxID=182803 RepID=A0A4Y2H2T9_ARAVE|nr:hypothetical protein AVEN_131049-1 [Araneus ventricosus]